MTNDKEIITALKAARPDDPELGPVIDLHCDLLETCAQQKIDIPVPTLSPGEATASISRGRPLLRGREPLPAPDTLATRITRLAGVIVAHRPDLEEAVQAIVALFPAANEYNALAAGYLRKGVAGLNGVDAPDLSLLVFMLNLALRPELHAAAAALRPLLDDSLWLQRPLCPLCGGEPDLALLDGESVRRLLCARCDTRWTYRRVGCPFCNSDNPAHLSYFLDETGVYRLHTCENCRRYLKTVDLRQAARPLPPPAERVLTVSMDLAARQAGYQ